MIHWQILESCQFVKGELQSAFWIGSVFTLRGLEHLMKYFSAALLFTFLSTNAFATPATPGDLKDAIAEHFVMNANNPGTQIGQTIAKLNQDRTDTFNPNGIISMPIKSTDLHQVTLNSQRLANPWVNAVKNGNTCTTTNMNAKFLILLFSKTMTVNGSHEDKITLTAKAAVKMTRQILNNSTQSCDDPNGAYSEVREEILLERCRVATVND